MTLNYYLGRFPGGESKANTFNQLAGAKTMSPGAAIKQENSQKGRKTFYVSQTFGFGSQCDLTNSPRQVEIRFKCGGSSGIISVEEVETCKYVLVFGHSSLCQLPGFQAGDNEENTIVCQTVNPPNNKAREIDQPQQMPEQIGSSEFQKVLSSPNHPFGQPSASPPNPTILPGSTTGTKTSSSTPNPPVDRKTDVQQALEKEMAKSTELAATYSLEELKPMVARLLDAKLTKRCFEGVCCPIPPSALHF